MKTNLLRGALALLLIQLIACADAGKPAQEADGIGVAQFALTGALPGVNYLTLSIYDGPVIDTGSQSPTFQPIACQKYAGAGGNRIRLQYLKASSSYTLYVELFGDDKCQKRVGFGWRGNVEVTGGNDLADVVPTYYVQPYLFGQFTGLAPVPQTLIDAAKLVSCTSDSDCKSVHVNGSCGKDYKCLVDALFPLDGGARRGFANSLALVDGSVAIIGGLTAPSNGAWAASKHELEVFDPLTGYFRSVLDTEQAFIPVGLAAAVTDGGNAIAVVGGSSDSNIALDPGKSLKTTIDATGCPGASCPVSNHVQRWDLASQTHADLPMTAAPGSLPVVSRVHAKSGDLLLIAGGALAPISKVSTLDSRQANASLCDLSQKGIITCKSSKSSLLAARANAATACLSSTADGTCTKLFILGGRKSAGTPLAEAYDAESDTFVPVTIADSAMGATLLHGGSLHKLANGNFLLLGAANSAPFIEQDLLTGTAQLQPPMIVAVTQGASSLTMQMVPVPMGAFAGTDGGKRLLASAVSLRDGSSLLIGGIDETLQPVADGLLFDANGQPVARAALASARFGATASLIGGKNALGGCALVAGGFTLTSAGAVTPQNHVEAFCPGP